MSQSTDNARTAFQEQLDWTMDEETLALDLPRERPGPVVVRNRIVLDGKGCTLWSRSGPVLSVTSEKVVLKNLRLEYTADGTDEGPNAGLALLAEGPELKLEGVTVRGAVKGLAAEDGEWRYPHQLNLGALAFGMDHTIRIRVVVPVACQLTSEISGLSIEPRTLAPGVHEVRLEIEQMMRDTLVCGTIGIKTKLLRREFVVNAHILAPAVGLPEPSREQDRIVWQPTDWERFAPKLPPSATVPKPVEVKSEPIASKPVVEPVSVPLAPADRKLRKVQGPHLGGLFASPPVEEPKKTAVEAPKAELPPDEEATPSSKPMKSVFRPKASGLFQPSAPATEAPPIVEQDAVPPSSDPAAPPKKIKFKPIGGMPGWVAPPKSSDPPAAPPA